ncbi:MAG: hypothetical protein EBX52_02915 [Proteobacteria bacterium]|nr:hypothetical protein [Pseudomonadota bacterium]
MGRGFLFLFSLISFSAHAIPVGFNQAWFRDRYAHQYLDAGYDHAEVERIFHLARSGGARTVRLWFFESLALPMLEWEGDRVKGVRADYVRNVIRMLGAAREQGVQVYMTLLDAQMYRLEQKDESAKARFKKLVAPEGFRDFLEHAVKPLLSAIHQAGLSDRVARVDLMNEGDVLVFRRAFERGWKDAAAFLCQGRGAVRSVPGFEQTPVSFSVRLSMMLPLPLDFLSPQGPMACADFIDFHSYNDEGGIHGCGRLRRHVQSGGKTLILGEFGQSYFNKHFDDALQIANTRAYLRSAEECGFEEALAWRLSDIRPGRNIEARYSFETESGTRPAFEVIRQHSGGR